MAFSGDGQTFLTAVTGVGETYWSSVQPMAGEVERLVLWAQLITGLELDEGGQVRTLDGDSWHRRHDRLQQLGGPPGQSAQHGGSKGVGNRYFYSPKEKHRFPTPLLLAWEAGRPVVAAEDEERVGDQRSRTEVGTLAVGVDCNGTRQHPRTSQAGDAVTGSDSLRRRAVWVSKHPY